MRYALLVPLIASAVAGCATLQAAGTRSTEEVLSAAGFHVEAADTPEKLVDLQTPPARQVLADTHDGKTSYLYRDPSPTRSRARPRAGAGARRARGASGESGPERLRSAALVEATGARGGA